MLYNIAMVKKAIKGIKKAAKKVTDAVVFDTDEIYNEYGTCIPCQGGKKECLHSNQAQDGRNVVCVTCGLKIR